MALAVWTSIDLRSDIDQVEWHGDPAEIVDAAAELLALLERPEWHRRSSCRGQGTRLFFPRGGRPPKEALAVCNSCPVRTECADAGRLEAEGVWGWAASHGDAAEALGCVTLSAPGSVEGRSMQQAGHRWCSGTASQEVHARRNSVFVDVPQTGLSGRPGTPASSMR